MRINFKWVEGPTLTYPTSLTQNWSSLVACIHLWAPLTHHYIGSKTNSFVLDFQPSIEIKMLNQITPLEKPQSLVYKQWREATAEQYSKQVDYTKPDPPIRPSFLSVLQQNTIKC